MNNLVAPTLISTKCLTSQMKAESPSSSFFSPDAIPFSDGKTQHPRQIRTQTQKIRRHTEGPRMEIATLHANTETKLLISQQQDCHCCLQKIRSSNITDKGK
ncbi:hypothetical protein Tco_0799818 [Tanacetum coccineum]|uniref:Uncharacterized protein n=1 Tax=Tanacetum coccineum TaxID=301880 RepID=A0ABQ4ZRD7_9ASTR